MTRKKKKVSIILGIIAAVIILLLAGFSYYVGNQVFEGSTRLITNEETREVPDGFWDDYGIDYDEFCDKYKVEKTEITSSLDGHTIPADYIWSYNKNNNVVVMVHGLGGNRFTNYPIAKFFLENGYNVVTYDQRSTNENMAERSTFGYLEKYDLIDCINFAQQYALGYKIGVWGESFGGATAVQGAAFEKTQDYLSFLILDCPVSSMEWMVTEEMKSMNTGMPVGYMAWCGNFVNKMKLGFTYKDADSAQAAKKITIPSLVINSETDTITPYFMGKDIFDNLASTDKELWTVDDCGHTEMWLKHNKEYQNRVLKIIG
ncbi:MAG: alpha/beta hydrolase [Oscillospiraceae bacterium]|nr:alpha/beta hydrolase [Oscillospiraceae bacterium]